MEDGTTYINEYLIKALKLSEDYLEREKAKAASGNKTSQGTLSKP